MKKINIDIIRRKINGSLSSIEETEFNNWLEGSSEHKKYFERVEAYSRMTIENLDIANVSNTTSEFMNRLDKKSRLHMINVFFKYAAAIMIPVFIAGGLWFFTGKVEIKQLANITKQENPKSIREQALLLTSAGKTYELESGDIKSIESEEGVIITKGALKYDKQNKEKPKDKVYNILKTPRGGEYHIELSDGSKVFMNSESELKYPVDFGNDDRIVELKGEAFFEVSKTGKPFVVSVGGVSIKVLGTRFNVMAYSDEKFIETTLVSGKVNVNLNDGSSKSVTLVPGKQASWNRNSGELVSKSVDTNLYTGWINGYFRFENQRLEDLLRNISRSYDMEIKYMDNEVKDKLLTGKLYRFDDFSVIVSMLEKISNVKIRVKGNRVEISNIK